jgi:dynein heavy chain
MLCKINRIISNPFGHILSIGLGGSGSHTLTRLATYMQAYELYEIEMEKDFGNNEWLEFIRDMLRDIVIKDKTVVFLISDSQIVSEKFLEDINNLLNIGEIPNLFPTDDKEALLSEVKDIADKLKIDLNTAVKQWEYFVNKCKMNLHIVMCLSPVGDRLRTRLRNFPSIVSCTSPMWVLPWSIAALKEVAEHMFSETAQDL